MTTPWTKNMRRTYLRDRYADELNADLARLMGVSAKRIRKDAQELGLHKSSAQLSKQCKQYAKDHRPRNTGAESWPEPLIEMFDFIYPFMFNYQISELIDISLRSVCMIAKQRNLVKTAAPPKSKSKRTPEQSGVTPLPLRPAEEDFRTQRMTSVWVPQTMSSPRAF